LVHTFKAFECGEENVMALFVKKLMHKLAEKNHYHMLINCGSALKLTERQKATMFSSMLRMQMSENSIALSEVHKSQH